MFPQLREARQDTRGEKTVTGQYRGKVPSLKLVPKPLEATTEEEIPIPKEYLEKLNQDRAMRQRLVQALQKQWSTPSRPRESACLEDTICGMVGCPGTPLTIVGDVVADLPQADKGAPGTGYPCPLHQIVHEAGDICDYFDAWGKRIRHRDLRSDIEAGRKAAREAIQQMNPLSVEATVCMVETAGVMPAAQPATSIAPSIAVQAISTQTQTEPPPTTNHWSLETDQRVWRRTPGWCTSAQPVYETVQRPLQEAPVMAPTLQFTAQPDVRTLQPPVRRISATPDDQQTPVGRPMSSRTPAVRSRPQSNPGKWNISERGWKMPQFDGKKMQKYAFELWVDRWRFGCRKGSTRTRCGLGDDGIHH